jgi:NAD(P)-dependent dehydrogenase (short-subunit alcohol dehydrogenase family)
MSKVWFITGAGRGMGVDIAKAALAAGHKVVATGRNTDKVAEALGKSANLSIGKLDITKPADAESAVKATVDMFGRIDVLVNNAANFYAGFFEELAPEQMQQQLSTSLIGPMNVTRAILPVMRKQRSGLIITISSTAGLIVLNSVPPTLRRSSALRAGCSRYRPRSNLSASIPLPSIRDSFARSF